MKKIKNLKIHKIFWKYKQTEKRTKLKKKNYNTLSKKNIQIRKNIKFGTYKWETHTEKKLHNLETSSSRTTSNKNIYL